DLKMAEEKIWMFKYFLLISTYILVTATQDTNYLVGVGIGDVTGSVAGVNMMGYANPSQTTEGIHTRLFSRAFIVADKQAKNRVVFVSVDCGMVSRTMKMGVIKALQTKFNNLMYTEENVVMSGTHTHSGPAGFHQYVLYDVTSLGFVGETLNAFIDGVTRSIERAHANLRPGNLLINEGELVGSNINRSPTAYANNPAEERAKYKYNTDTNMTMMTFVDASGKALGLYNWFPVHATSMNNTNHLISGDNKGYASQLFEKDMNPGSRPGKGPFVAAFGQANEGDVSPNTKGPHCQNTGEVCDIAHSTCGGKSELCYSAGPGKDMFDSTKIIGHNQYAKAKELFNAPSRVLPAGPVDFRHQFVDFSKVVVKLNATTKVKTCPPSMGFSFAAGTTDGPGAFDFTQGDTKGNAFWKLISGLVLHNPSDEQKACQHPKPILIDTGEITTPYAWQPDILDLQILRIGDFIIVAVPGEFTTMSGRRLKDAVRNTLMANGFPSTTKVVICGLSNVYSSYIATYEEYQVQRYEGASTLYGPHTLQAYIQEFTNMSVAMAKGVRVPPGPTPPNLLSKQLSFLPPVIMDEAPFLKSFGDVLTDVQPKYAKGSTVQAEFVTGHPRNNPLQEATFLTVEKKEADGTWSVQYTDADWDTKFQWVRTNTILGHSKAVITWTVPTNQETGTYRIRHFGYSKSLTGTLTPFKGASSEFEIEEGPLRWTNEMNRASERFNELNSLDASLRTV
ncbi:unnamed protein product, partial [Owenia fusiformis]